MTAFDRLLFGVLSICCVGLVYLKIDILILKKWLVFVVSLWFEKVHCICRKELWKWKRSVKEKTHKRQLSRLPFLVQRQCIYTPPPPSSTSAPVSFQPSFNSFHSSLMPLSFLSTSRFHLFSPIFHFSLLLYGNVLWILIKWTLVFQWMVSSFWLPSWETTSTLKFQYVTNL